MTDTTDKPRYILTRPLLINVWLEWFRLSNIIPYIKVTYDKEIMPEEWEKKVHDGVVVFNISDSRALNILIDEEGLSFTGKYRGRAREYFIPLNAIVSLLNYDFKMELLIGEHIELYNVFDELKKLNEGDDKPVVKSKPVLRLVK